MIFFIFFAYEYFVATVLQSKDTSWYMVLLLIGVDISENLLAVVLLRRRGGDLSTWLKGLNPEAGNLETTSALYGYIVSLAIREIAEISAPLCYLLMSVILSYTNPKMNDNFAHATGAELRQGIIVVGADVLFEMAVLLLTIYVMNKSGGIDFYGIMHGATKRYFWFFVSTQYVCVAYFAAMQHAYSGMDFSLRFAWVGDDRHDARWLGGLCYVTDPTVMTYDESECV